MPNNDQSLSDQNTFDGDSKDTGPKSLGDEKTFSGGARQTGPQSLGDEQTFGGSAPDSDSQFDDGMEVVDLSARYTIEGILGKGGMGEVLLATDTRLNRKVAIKRILGDAAASRTAVSRFLTEAQSIAALNHPNIVQIYDYGRATDGPFLIIEYVEGSSLLERCREGAIPIDEAIELTCQLCDGLGKAHDANIIHRDIKPANVLLTADGIPKLTDFGLAKDESADAGLSVAGAVLGTLDFMSPEQRRDVALTDSRSDLWSLAATLYQMVTGKSPKIIRFNDVPQSLHEVLGKSLEDEKDARYQTAREFRDALRASQQGDGTIELEEGDCPSCGTKNPVNRKFCRNEACGSDLQVPCLSCSKKMPMWEGVCDSCGTKQSELSQQRRDRMASDQSEAESLLKVYNFDRAAELATALLDEPDLRLQHLKGWAEKFLPQVEQGRHQQLERTSTQLTEAAAHELAHDYAAGLRVLEQVPEILRETHVPDHNDTVAGVMSRLRSTLNEIKRLDAEIRQRVKARSVNGLLAEVNQLLKFQPDRNDIKKLKTQLQERDGKLTETRDEAYIAAEQKLLAQDYDGVLEEIARIDESMLRAEITQLRDAAMEKRDRLKALRAAISEGVKTKQLHGLLKKVDESLSLKSGDTDLEKLRGQLQAREEKNAAQVAGVIEKAQSLRQECRFEAASNALRRIPQELVTQDVSDLLDDCDYLADLRENVMSSLKPAMDAENYGSWLAKTKDYRVSLENESLDDDEFSRAYAACEKALKDQREAEDAAERRRASTKKLAFGGAAVTAVALLIAAGLWIRSIQNAAAEADAVSDAVAQERWDDALAIDENCFSALVGRARSRIDSDPTGALEDLELAATAPVTSVDSAQFEMRIADLDRLIPVEENAAKEQRKIATSQPPTSPRLSREEYRQFEKARDNAFGQEDVHKANVDRMKNERALIADQLNDLSNHDGRALLLNSLKALAYTTRAASLATSGKIADAEKDLKEVERLGASNSTFTQARKALAAAYVDVAKDAAQSGNATQVVASVAAAVEYDESVEIPIAVLVVCADASVKKFEQSSSDADRDAVLTAIDRLQMTDPSSRTLEECRQRVAAVLLTRSGATVASDLSAASADYIMAIELGTSEADSGSLKDQLMRALTARCRQSIDSQDIAKATADYSVAQKLDPQAAGVLIYDFQKLPTNTLSLLPISTLSQLPASVRSQLPPRKNSLGMAFKVLPAGTFLMGEEKNVRRVTLTRPFEMGVYEVTQEQYEQLMGTNPSYHRYKGPQNAVGGMTADQAIEFCRKLSELPAELSSGYVYRLPTEAEWEYACRAGTITAFSFGDSESELDAYVQFSPGTAPVGQKKPNPWGLYDMHGNVCEWCSDWYNWDGGYPTGPQIDPRGLKSGDARVRRGGSYNNRDFRSGRRVRVHTTRANADCGFRVVRSSVN
jgi:serine/threonine protein kinase/formylglycine-generating enzyme required for sulfatase activity